MKLLFDENLSFKLCAALADLFPNSTQVGHIGLKKADDEAVGMAAKSGDFIVVSQDSDFADLALHRGPPPNVIWLRCGNQRTSTIDAISRRNTNAIIAFCATTDAVCLEIY